LAQSISAGIRFASDDPGRDARSRRRASDDSRRRCAAARWSGSRRPSTSSPGGKPRGSCRTAAPTRRCWATTTRWL
jgi:hypothetical protein